MTEDTPVAAGGDSGVEQTPSYGIWSLVALFCFWGGLATLVATIIVTFIDVPTYPLYGGFLSMALGLTLVSFMNQ